MFYSFCFSGYVNIWSDLQICAVFLVIPDGTISSSSILLAQSLQHCIHSQTCAATDLFYQGNSQAIREWLTVAITRTLHQGEESLLDLTKQICSFLQVKRSLMFHECWLPFSGAFVLCVIVISMMMSLTGIVSLDEFYYPDCGGHTENRNSSNALD